MRRLRDSILASTALMLLLAGCTLSSHSQAPIFDSHPRYPITQITLSKTLRLRHLAGPSCAYDDPDHPAMGSEGMKSCSYYLLLDVCEHELLRVPSMLSDPATAPLEFQSYFRANDCITAFLSRTGNTALIVEDRSPTFPVRAHILLQRRDADWRWRQIEVSSVPHKIFAMPPYGFFPTVVGLTDAAIQFNAEGRSWSAKLPDAETASKRESSSINP